MRSFDFARFRLVVASMIAVSGCSHVEKSLRGDPSDPDLDPRLVGGFVRVTVNVADSQGLPLNARVRIEGPGPGVDQFAEAGRRELLLTPGSWEVSISKPCYESFTDRLELLGTEGRVTVTAELLRIESDGKFDPVIAFGQRQVEVLPETAEELSEVKAALLADPHMTVEIRGYQRAASEHIEGDLAIRRAVEARDWLIGKGVPPEQVIARGGGQGTGPAGIEVTVLSTGDAACD